MCKKRNIVINHTQWRILMNELNSGNTLKKAAIKSEMSINSARKYRSGSTVD